MTHQERHAEAEEQRSSALAAKLGGLEDVQTLRGLWQSADNAAAFLAGTQAQGYTVARVTERDARMSRGEAQTLASGDPSRTPPIYGGRLLQLDPEIQNALRREREARAREEHERDDNERGRER